MAFLPGFKKQFNKANQIINERILGVEGTKLNEEYTEMERKTDLTIELVEELIIKTKEYLQPNPATRSKMMLNSKVNKNTRVRNYAQPEGVLGETILRVAHRYGEDSPFVRSLLETGEAFKQMAEIKYALEDDIKQDFLEPLSLLQNKDLRDVIHHRKKLESRRLDFDCKKRKRPIQAGGAAGGPNGAVDEEMKVAEDKFEESFNLASQGMHNLLQNDVEQISQFCALTEALRDFHKQCGSILEGLTEKLVDLRTESEGRQRIQYTPRKLNEININNRIEPLEAMPEVNNNNAQNVAAADGSTKEKSPEDNEDKSSYDQGDQKCGYCVALYDFQAENPGELSFSEGQIIKLIDQIDENWFEGSAETSNGGQTGMFPTNYVQVTRPIPGRSNDNESANNGN